MASPTPGPGGPKRMFGPTALFVTVFSLFVVGALGGGALRWATVRKESPAVPTTSAPVLPPSPFDLPSSAAEPTPTMSLAPVPTPTEHKKVDRQKQALDRLRRQAAKDSTDFPFDGRWAVQVASKYVGSTDRFQKPESGNTFKATDIWAEYSRLKSRLDPPYTVKLLHRGNRIGANTGQKFWYTFVTDDFGSRAAAQEFCNEEFSELSRAERDNQCLPRQLPRI